MHTIDSNKACNWITIIIILIRAKQKELFKATQICYGISTSIPWEFNRLCLWLIVTFFYLFAVRKFDSGLRI